MPDIVAEKALYIKLGESGLWQTECIQQGTLRLGYKQISHELCTSNNWAGVLEEIQKRTSNRGAATRHLNQIRLFYESPEDVLWFTFDADRLYWCFALASVELNTDGSKIRRTIQGWSDKNTKGALLLKKNISGKILATQGFQGTICSAPELTYLLHKINGTAARHVDAAQFAFNNLVDALVPIIKNLHEKDLEILADLIFRQGGWSRIGVLGGTEQHIDLDLISPITGERIAVQVKSRADEATYNNYKSIFSDMRGYSKFYFITHSPTASLASQAAQESDQEFIFWGAQELAEYSAKNGLVGWLIDKAS
jgi:hypothetical protein